MRRGFVAVAAVAAGSAAAAWWAAPTRAAGPTFELAPSNGYIVLNDVIVGPGVRVISKFNGSRASQCIAGTAQDDYCRQYLESGANGHAYVAYDSASSWRFFTKQMGTETTLTGNVDPTGAFMMSGTHALSGAQLFFVGKAKFKKGTTQPESLSGTLYFTSTLIQEFGQLKFKSVAKTL